MYVFLPPQTPSVACTLTLPPDLQICSTMVLTDIISDVLALLTLGLLHSDFSFLTRLCPLYELREGLAHGGFINTYDTFEDIFMLTLNKHAPQKSKVLRANDKPFMTKALRKAIMRRSALKNKFYKTGSPDIGKAYKTQRNYTKRLLKREKKKYFHNLDTKNYTDNKKFWKTVKPLFSNSTGGSQKITLSLMTRKLPRLSMTSL